MYRLLYYTTQSPSHYSSLFAFMLVDIRLTMPRPKWSFKQPCELLLPPSFLCDSVRSNYVSPISVHTPICVSLVPLVFHRPTSNPPTGDEGAWPSIPCPLLPLHDPALSCSHFSSITPTSTPRLLTHRLKAMGRGDSHYIASLAPAGPFAIQDYPSSHTSHTHASPLLPPSFPPLLLLLLLPLVPLQPLLALFPVHSKPHTREPF